MNSKWKTLSSVIDYQNKWLKVMKNIILNKKGTKYDYFYVSLSNFVIIVAVNDEGKIAFTRNYRYIVDTNQLETPAGIIEKNEDIEVAAKRELEEETGLIAKNIKILGEFFTSNGSSDQKGYAVLATDFTLSKPHLDEFEEIEAVEFYSVSEIKKMIANNEITDGPCLTALLMYFSKNDL
jgi:ADP-ribose pyrophosphatase